MITVTNVIDEYKKGLSIKQIHKKFGDFGKFVIEKYKKQDLSFSQYYKTMDKIDPLKVEIIKSYHNGTSEKEIFKLYGDYGKTFLRKYKEFLKVPKL